MRNRFSTIFRIGLTAVFALLLLPSKLMAQGSPPPPPPTDGSGPPCWPPPCIPIDTNLMILLVGGVLFGAWLLMKMQRSKVAAH